MLFVIPENGITFHTYMKDETTVAISNFAVHSEQGKGTGTAAYTAWERTIPPRIKRIILRAKNARAAQFWTKMGFVDEEGFPHDEEGGRCMVKELDR